MNPYKESHSLSCCHYTIATVIFNSKPLTSNFASAKFYGAPEGIRTPGPLLRRQLLYPTELQAQLIIENRQLSIDNFTGRGERIRTSDILLPKQARYQAALRPDKTVISEQ